MAQTSPPLVVKRSYMPILYRIVILFGYIGFLVGISDMTFAWFYQSFFPLAPGTDSLERAQIGLTRFEIMVQGLGLVLMLSLIHI